MSSVCPSVCVDHDHIGWKYWKLIAQTLSLTPSLFVAQRPSTYSRGYMGKFSGDTGQKVGWEKVVCWTTKAAIYLKRVQIGNVTMGPIGTHQRFFSNGTIPDPTRPTLPQDWGSHPIHPKPQSLLSQERVKLYELQIWPEQ